MVEQPLIKTDKLNVVYFLGRPNQVNAVTDVDLEIFPGEFVIFFGPSGCGKSTLLYSIAGLERNIQGDVLVNGKNLAKFNRQELDDHRQHTIGMIFQAYYLISSLSVANNIILPQFSLKTGKKERTKKADELLNFFGVGQQKDKYPNELSGGQQQRIAICRALMNEPDLILADEPTGNLDSKAATDVMNLLTELNEKKGKTIVLVTHSPGSLAYAHRVFHMKDGKIIGVTVNRQRQQPLQSAVLSADVLAKDLGKVSENKTIEVLPPAEPAGILAEIKAREIVAEALTGLSLEELGRIEKIVAKMIGGQSGQVLLDYFDDSGHGLGLDTRLAHKLSGRIKDVLAEIKILQQAEQKSKNQLAGDSTQEIVEIRHYLLEQFDVKLKDSRALLNFDSIIRDRLSGGSGAKETRLLFRQPIMDNGAGLDKRLVKKIAKRLELLILGKI